MFITINRGSIIFYLFLYCLSSLNINRVCKVSFVFVFFVFINCFSIFHLFSCEQVLFVYVSTIIPPRLTDPHNFIYCTISNLGTGADDAFVLKRGVWRNATWPSHSRPVIAASARHFQICFLP